MVSDTRRVVTTSSSHTLATCCTSLYLVSPHMPFQMLLPRLSPDIPVFLPSPHQYWAGSWDHVHASPLRLSGRLAPSLNIKASYWARAWPHSENTCTETICSQCLWPKWCSRGHNRPTLYREKQIKTRCPWESFCFVLIVFLDNSGCFLCVPECKIKTVIFLPQPLKHRGYRCVPPLPAPPEDLIYLSFCVSGSPSSARSHR